MNKIKEKLEKVVVNAGVGKMATTISGFESKVLPELIKELSLITGQKPALRMAKKSIAGFKLREGMTSGLKVTLRGKKMTDFLNRLNQVVMPRLRDFRGINLKNIDSNGNLSIGLREQVVFPEIDPETSKTSFGLQITLVPKDKYLKDAPSLYRDLGVPLEKTKEPKN